MALTEHTIRRLLGYKNQRHLFRHSELDSLLYDETYLEQELDYELINDEHVRRHLDLLELEELDFSYY